MAPLDGQLGRFCYQYLQMEKLLDYPEPTLLRLSSSQETLCETLFADGAIPFGPPHRYRLKVLKELLRRIEESIEDWDEHGVSDNLMDVFGEMLALPVPPESETVQQMDHVTYHLSLLERSDDTSVLDHSITMLESRWLYATAGTTGRRTWEAGLHLGQYLCSHPEVVRRKRVLELGTGTGYISVLCAKYLGAKKVVASDGSEDVLNALSDAMFLNGLQGSKVFTTRELIWGTALLGTEEEAWNGGEEIDVVLGSDITYDTRAIPALIGTLHELFGLYPRVAVIICTAERNVATLNTLLELCKGAGLLVEYVDFSTPPASDQRGPFYDTSVPIHIVNIKKP